MNQKLPKRRSFRRGGCRGDALVEFALTIIIVLFLIFSMIEFCMALYTYNVLGDAAREGVRYAIVHGSNNSNCSGGPTGPPAGCDPTGSNVQTVVTNYAKNSLHNMSGMTVAVNYLDGGNSPQNRVQVAVTYAYVPYITSVAGINLTIKTSAVGRIVN